MTPPTSPVVEENMADDQMLGGPLAATGGTVGSPQAAGPSSSLGRPPAPPSGNAGAGTPAWCIYTYPEDLDGNPRSSSLPAAASSQDIDQPKPADAVFTGAFKIGYSRCASENCPFAITGVSPTHCCKWCSTESGKHGKKCQKYWHIPGDTEGNSNDWLVNGLPSKFALLLPHERAAFL